ncbi:ATP-binding protein [Saccharibacillus sp. CPCC 101409]|uniref:ATP-binding protein n=1 Tax=Saccharibacillus sp. CPCC 101409 TaxID=3058041 RepID=UPI0026731540|nr:ATP-binding protein [Saccharibacillus sp. CPCC 101409]MDO3409118.1 ATP-binding protein [Saccharibacillus sp. CPCC 101409]
MQAFFRNEKVQMFAVALGTAAAGEFKINPVPGDLFRIGLGGSAFLLFLLLMNRLPFIKTGLWTAAVVVAFRTLLDLVFAPAGGFRLSGELAVHISGGLYYLVFALGMRTIQRRIERMNPLLLGAVCAGIDLTSNTAEMCCRWLLNGSDISNAATWGYIALVGAVRGFFMTGLYSSIAVSQIRALNLEQNKRMEQMLAVSSGLYGEVFYLRKSMDAIEHATGSGYRLYADLKREGLADFSRRQLAITQEMHEVKKDSQRIAAGLLKLFEQEAKTRLSLGEIARYAVRGNQKYAMMLSKQIVFDVRIRADYHTSEHLPLLSLLNNLLANAVEAIDRSGAVGLEIYTDNDDTVLLVTDTGPGIPEKDRELVFEPGFTTKFGREGSAATGIGLSHVHDIAQTLGGEIRLFLPAGDVWSTAFEAVFATEALNKGE